jgi:hypothetical protein
MSSMTRILTPRTHSPRPYSGEGCKVVAGSPEYFRAFIVGEQARFSRIMRACGIKLEEG